MDHSRTREASRWFKSLAPSILVEEQDTLHRCQQMGLYRWEAWQLPDGEEYTESSKVCNKRKRLHKPRHRRPLLVEKQDLEEGESVRVSSTADTGRQFHRRLVRQALGTRTPAPEEITRFRKILTSKEKEDSKAEFDTLYSPRYVITRPGFSGTGSLDEYESTWETKTFQTEAAMAVGEYKPWEDISDADSDEILPYFHRSPGYQSS